LFKAHLIEEAVMDIRKATSREQPLGNERFFEEVEAVLDRWHKPMQQGHRVNTNNVEPLNRLILGL